MKQFVEMSITEERTYWLRRACQLTTEDPATVAEKLLSVFERIERQRRPEGQGVTR